MKNFPYRENYAHLCTVFPMYGNPFTLLPIRSNTSGSLQKTHNFAATLSAMRYVFFISRQNILYRIKIKSPE
nr:hypothetical protein [uncultured Draconibacterium sp.]